MSLWEKPLFSFPPRRETGRNAGSVPPLTAAVLVTVKPVRKNASMLSGWEIHGVGVHPGVPAPGLVNWQIVRPGTSSFGPQLWSAPSLTPAPEQFLHENDPPAPWPYWFCQSGRIDGRSHVREIGRAHV